jgi:signal transduction histidine kinase
VCGNAPIVGAPGPDVKTLLSGERGTPCTSTPRLRENRVVTVEELLRLLDALPASVALWDRDVRLRYGNTRSLVRFGRPYDDLIGAHLSEVVQPHAVVLSAPYIEGALAGRVQQVERAMIDPEGQRYNAHQVTHVPNVVDGVVQGYCALAVDITASIERFELARRARERAALRAERERIAGDIGGNRVVDGLGAALDELDAALLLASDVVPSLSLATDAINDSIRTLRESVPARLLSHRRPDGLLVGFPRMAPAADLLAETRGVAWPAHITGAGWSADDVRALLDLLPAAVLAWDADFATRYANRAATRWFGAEPVASAIFDEALAQASLLGEPQNFARTISVGGVPRHMQVCYAPSESGVLAFAVDVTPRVEAELALQDARAELAATRERARIADELHEQVLQQLFAAGVSAAMPSAPGAAPAAAAGAQVQAVQGGIVAALDGLETALTRLYENAGLVDLLPELARAVYLSTELYDIQTAVENVGSIEYIPPTVAVELLAVADAALANVLQHAQATSIVVTVAADASGVWLRVADDGRGTGGDMPRGNGSTDMAERAARLGGTCTWLPNTPSGTIVDWKVPAEPLSGPPSGPAR